MDKKFELIKKYLKKKKEEVIIDLIIKDYDRSNFYIALIFNKRIDKFRVLFIPVDILDDDNVEDYCCYQFVMLSSVNYILEILNEEEKNINKDFCNKLSKTLKSYYIEINTHINNKDYKFMTNQFIPKEWEFLFEIIVILFEHCPNIVSELCIKLLEDFNSTESIAKYDYSLEMDIFDDKLGIVDDSCNGVDFLEKIKDKYYCVIDDYIFVLEYNNYKKLLNIYSDCEGEINIKYLYSIISAIRNEYERSFYKLLYKCDDIYIEYLCYGMTNDSFKVIKNNKHDFLPIDLLNDGILKLSGSKNSKFESIIRKYFSDKYTSDELDIIIDNIYCKEK